MLASDLLIGDLIDRCHDRVNETTAMAQRIDTTAASVGVVSAAVEQNSQAIATVDGRVKAYYTMKVQATPDGKNYYVAGMSIGIDNSSGIMQSQILFQADRFALLSLANGGWYTPFVIENGEVFINRGFIGKGWITNLMIGDVIQSNDYVSGQRGWRIDKNGSFEINSADGGGRTVINQYGGQVYGPNGGLLVRWGRW